MRTTHFALLLAIGAIILQTGRSAEAGLIHWDCSAVEGFDLCSDSRGPIGYVDYLKIGNEEMDSDFRVNQRGIVDLWNADVPAIITRISWEGGSSDPIFLLVRLSEANAARLRALMQREIGAPEVRFAFEVFDYHSLAGCFYRCFSTAGVMLGGVLAVEGGEPAWDIASAPAEDVAIPRNYLFSIAIAQVYWPEQDPVRPPGNRRGMPWGTYVPEPTALVTLGWLALAVCGRRRG